MGALEAQLELEIGSIGGKDSMSGTFEDIDVPPTLVSFAVSTAKADRVVSTELKAKIIRFTDEAFLLFQWAARTSAA